MKYNTEAAEKPAQKYESISIGYIQRAWETCIEFPFGNISREASSLLTTFHYAVPRNPCSDLSKQGQRN